MCLHPDTSVIVGTLNDLHVMSLRELKDKYRYDSFEIPTLNPKTLRPENDEGHIVESGVADLYIIALEDGRQILASSEHPFFMLRSEMEIIRTREMIDGTMIADFGDKFLICDNCGKLFYRHYPNDLFQRCFCSKECRNKWFGNLSKTRSLQERRIIALSGAQALKEKGVYQSEEYRRKRSEIAHRLKKEGKFTNRKSPRYWLGKELGEEHRKHISEGVRRTLKEHPEIKEKISRSTQRALAQSEKYKKLIESGFFKRIAYERWKRSVKAWKKMGYRSNIEEKMANLLKTWKIPFNREVYMRLNGTTTSVDFMLDGKVALLVNGCWWHCCKTCNITPKHPSQRANLLKDFKLIEALKEKGYGVVVVWEHELSHMNNMENVKERIYEALGISGHGKPKIKHANVKSIKYIGKCEVLNISVKKNKNFFLANGILTHNTSDAQQALRRTMERFTETCRFILIANYSGKIIEPIQSRCAPFRFSHLSREDHDRYLRNIIQQENVKILDEAFDAIFEVSEGDLRKATNTLQAAFSLGRVIDAETVYSVIGRANPANVREMIALAMKGDFIGARQRLREMIMKYGVAGSDIIKQIHIEIFRSGLPDQWKVKLAEAIGEIDFRLVQGADEEVQLSALLARLTEAGYELKRGG
jgi:replication factor C small subunit